jgi:hypothetical protein
VVIPRGQWRPGLEVVARVEVEVEVEVWTWMAVFLP